MFAHVAMRARNVQTATSRKFPFAVIGPSHHSEEKNRVVHKNEFLASKRSTRLTFQFLHTAREHNSTKSVHPRPTTKYCNPVTKASPYVSRH